MGHGTVTIRVQSLDGYRRELMRKVAKKGKGELFCIISKKRCKSFFLFFFFYWHFASRLPVSRRGESSRSDSKRKLNVTREHKNMKNPNTQKTDDDDIRLRVTLSTV
jgi:hypothetical protein